MTLQPSRRPSRADITKSMREIEALWKPPPDPGKDTAAGAGTEAAARESNDNAKNTPTSDGRQP